MIQPPNQLFIIFFIFSFYKIQKMLPYFTDPQGNFYVQENIVNWYYCPAEFIPPIIEPSLNHPTQNQKILVETREGQQVKIQEIYPKLEQDQDNEQNRDFDVSLPKRKKTTSAIKTQQDHYQPKHQKSGSDRFLPKNIQFNLLNQLFSFIWNKKKSQPIIEKYYRFCSEKIALFYDYLAALKKGIRKIISMKVLFNLCDFNESHSGYKTIASKKQSIKILSVKEFSATIRFVINHYLKQVCPLTVLTSKKMRKHIRIQHLVRARQLRQQFFPNNEKNIEQQQVKVKIDDNISLNYQF